MKTRANPLNVISIVTSFVIWFQLTGCSSAPGQSTVTKTPLSESTKTVDSTLVQPAATATHINLPAVTNTPFPAPTRIRLSFNGTPQSAGAAAITAENALRLQEVARWGMGEVLGAVHSPDGQQIAVLRTQGITFLSGSDYATEVLVHTPFEVKHVSFAAKEDIAALASLTGDVWVVNYLDGRVLQQFYYPLWDLRSIAISPGGNLVLVGSSSGVYSQPILEAPPISSPLESVPANSIAFSPNGSLAATGFDGPIEIWKIETGECVQKIDNDGWVDDLIFSPDGSMLAGFVRDRLVVWQVRDAIAWATVLAINTGDFDPLYSVDSNFAISPGWDSAAIHYHNAAGSALRLVSLPGGEVLQEIVLEESQMSRFLAFGHGVDSIITILENPGSEGDVNLSGWDLKGKTMNHLKKLSRKVTSLSASPNAGVLAEGLSDGEVRLLDANTGQYVLAFPEKHELAVTGLQFIDQGKKLVSSAGGAKNLVMVWDASGGRKIFGYDAPANIIDEGYKASMELSPDGNSSILRTYRDDGVYRIKASFFFTTWYNNHTGDIIASLKVKSTPPKDGRAFINRVPYLNPLAISPDGKSAVAFLGAVGEPRDAGYYFWTAGSETGEKIISDDEPDGAPADTPLGKFSNRVNPDGIVFSPDGSLMAASQGLAIRIWRVGTWEVVSEPSIPMAAQNSSSAVEPFKTTDGTAVPRTLIHPVPYPDTINVMHFSSDGQILAAAGENGILRIWRVMDGELLALIQPASLRGDRDLDLNTTAPFNPSILALTFSTDNRRIYVGDAQGVVHVYAVTP